MKYFLPIFAIALAVIFVLIMSKLRKNQNEFFDSVDDDFPEMKNLSLFSYKQHRKTNSEFGNLYEKHRTFRNKMLSKWYLIIILTMVVIIIAGIISSHYSS